MASVSDVIVYVSDVIQHGNAILSDTLLLMSLDLRRQTLQGLDNSYTGHLTKRTQPD